MLLIKFKKYNNSKMGNSSVDLGHIPFTCRQRLLVGLPIFTESAFSEMKGFVSAWNC